MIDNAVLRAAAWMIGAIVSFTLMAIAGRTLAVSHDTFEIMMYRSLTGMVIVISVGYFSGTLSQIRRRNLGLHTLRNAFHFAGQNLWFYAITVVPLAQVFALEFTTPIWATLLAPFFLGERLTKIRAFAATLGFIGVLIVARPGSGLVLSPGLIAAALAAVCFAFTAIATRFLTRTESITCILFYLTVIQAIFGMLTAGFDGEIALPTQISAPWLILVGCAGLLAHFCMTKALSLAPAGVVMPIDFARLPIIALVGVILYSEPLEWPVLYGALLIFLANYLNITSETHKNSVPSPKR